MPHTYIANQQAQETRDDFQNPIAHFVQKGLVVTVALLYSEFSLNLSSLSLRIHGEKKLSSNCKTDANDQTKTEGWSFALFV